jgi:hypothetical protein
MNNSIFKIEKIPKFSNNVIKEKLSILKQNISILSSLNKDKNLILSNPKKNNYIQRFTTQSFKMLNENEPINYKNNKNQKTNSSFFNLFPNNKNEFDFFQSKENIYNFTNESFSVNYLNNNNKNTQSLFQDNNIELEENTNYYNLMNFNNSILDNQNNNNINNFNNDDLNEKISKNIEDYNYNFIFKECEHNNCEQTFKTLKQKLNHHKKMEPFCRCDTINLIKCIKELKKIILNLKNKNCINSFPQLIRKYEKIVSNIPHKEYSQLLCGLKFYDINSNK